MNVAQWSATSLNGTVLGAVASQNTIVIFTTTNASGLYQSESSGSLNVAQWRSTSLNGNVLGAVSNKNQIAAHTLPMAMGSKKARAAEVST